MLRSRYDLTPAIQLWVGELQLAGVDLVEYGIKEKALQASDLVDTYLDVYWQFQEDVLNFRYFSLSYGPNPQDWHIWTSDPVDELANEFWEMMEISVKTMPGAWVE
jgi:hypothetical protein